MLIEPIYLAGGMHDNWRETVITAFPGLEFFDPCSHGLKDEKSYTAWDLAHIRKAETVFVYMDATNPSGFGLNLEAGYAKALGKRIIFVDETDEKRSRYFGMLRQIADEVYLSIQAALEEMSPIGTGGEGEK